MNRKIREAQLMKVPYMPVIGDREMEEGTVTLRKRIKAPQETMSIDAFIDFVQDKITSRTSEL